MEYTDIELNNEKWKDIEGYEGAYQVSNLGRVRSLKFGRVKVLRPEKCTCGYLCVNLYKNGKRKHLSVHRLVADAFIHNDNIFNTEVNHRNEDKTDNRVTNLEWCDRQYNNTYNDIQNRKKNSVRRKLKDIYDQNLSYDENIEIFRANGIECSVQTLYHLRRDLGLINCKQRPKDAL